MRCKCGYRIKNKKDIAVVYELFFKADTSKLPYAIDFRIVCRNCGAVLKSIRKEGKDAESMYRTICGVKSEKTE